MFNFRPSRFANGQEPWFRFGTVDFGTAGVVSLIVGASMFFRAAEGASAPVSQYLLFLGGDVTSGQVWRLFTWWIPNEPSLRTIIDVVLIYLFGVQLEGALGRERMAKFLGTLVLIPSGIALVLDLIGMSGTPLSFGGARILSAAIFYAYIAFMPNAKFFFGIPGWMMGVVFFGLEVLQAIGDRNTAYLLLVVFGAGFTLLATKAFGLAEEVPWIPDLRTVGGGSAGGATQAPARGPSKRIRRPKRSKSSADLSVVPDPVSSVDDFDEMGIDEILDQVNAFGMESLSSDQKRKLKDYSKRKKK